MTQNYDDLLKLKVCLVGDSGVGKTSLIRKFVYDEFSDKYLTTVGTKITKKKLVVPNPKGDGEIGVDMAVWDIMGQHGFRVLLQEAYFFGVDGIIAVCDLTRRETLEGAEDWLDSTREFAGVVPVITVGNKNDLEGQRNVKEEDLKGVAKKYSAECYTSSAKTGKNVEQMFGALTVEILRQIAERSASENLAATPQEEARKQSS
ncbi:MAG: GTP-binding protein [Thermoplasmata archaeon]|nr:GTP-binding protein [Thermoplasmata archaeon]